MCCDYKKITKEDIDFPKYCLFFIKEIQNFIDENEQNLSYTEDITVQVDTSYPYCSEAFDLIAKTFESKGVAMMNPSFIMEKINDVRHYHYKWRLKKMVNVDDLPF